jgi:hypothetical protein
MASNQQTTGIATVTGTTDSAIIAGTTNTTIAAGTTATAISTGTKGCQYGVQSVFAAFATHQVDLSSHSVRLDPTKPLDMPSLCEIPVAIMPINMTDNKPSPGKKNPPEITAASTT